MDKIVSFIAFLTSIFLKEQNCQIKPISRCNAKQSNTKWKITRIKAQSDQIKSEPLTQQMI